MMWYIWYDIICFSRTRGGTGRISVTISKTDAVDSTWKKQKYLSIRFSVVLIKSGFHCFIFFKVLLSPAGAVIAFVWRTSDTHPSFGACPSAHRHLRSGTLCGYLCALSQPSWHSSLVWKRSFFQRLLKRLSDLNCLEWTVHCGQDIRPRFWIPREYLAR